jgi:peroxin-11B
MDTWQSFMATTQGRDKFNRTLQYFARFLAYYLLKAGSTESAKKLALLSASIGLSRKRTTGSTNNASL